jgi:hypothetical protein
MGHIKHHGIAVTSGIDELIEEAHTKAKSIFKERASEILNSETNGYKSFFIAPDGSKEGWVASLTGNKQRDTFVKWINSKAYEDGSNSISFCPCMGLYEVCTIQIVVVH